MDFAKNLMKKYGWKEGDGLGKNNDGIGKPLKANLKFDNAGLGHDKASDFNNHWWERVYNDAASNLEVKNAENVTVATKSDDTLEISTKEYSVNKLKKLTGSDSYNNFLKSSTLSASGETENPDRIEIDEIGLSEFQPLTDEQLFAACGGRTAHKGARHGLKLSGKLARIEQQERELLNKIEKQSIKMTDEFDTQSWPTTSKKKKRKRRREMIFEEEPPAQENQDELAEFLDNTEYVTSKKKRKENSKRDKDLSSCLLAFSVDDNKLDDDGGTNLEQTFGSSLETKKRKRRKKKHRSIYEPIVDETPTGKESFDELDDQLTVNSLEVNISDSEQSTSQSTKKSKSKKVKKREKRIMKHLVSTLENTVVITD